MAEQNITIVGGSGFIGGFLARRLSDTFRVKVVDLRPISKDLEDVVSFEKVDIRSYNSVREVIKGADLVIHTAIVAIPQINKEKRLGYEVNVLGTQNLCEAVQKSKTAKGLLLTGTWHVFGDVGLEGLINEEYGCRPDKVEERAKYYTLTKVAQETIVRLYDESSTKIFGIVRSGTVLAEGMPEKTAANIFVTNALKGGPITPYRQSMHRPMLYVDGDDLCRAFTIYADKILHEQIEESHDSLAHIVDFAYPKPITILELAHIVKDAVVEHSNGALSPEIEVVDRELPLLYNEADKDSITLDITKVRQFLGIQKLTSPEKAVRRLIRRKQHLLMQKEKTKNGC